MKKGITIFFLSLLLFNALGYYVLLSYQQVQAHRIAIEDLPESSFKVVKMLVSPYANIEDRNFEYVEGSFFYEGKAYNFVKKRIKNDSLELYCINNIRQDQLTVQLNDYLNQNVINGKASSNQSAKQILKQFLKEYIPTYVGTLALPQIGNNKPHLLFRFKDVLTASYPPSLFVPPNLI